MLYNENISQQSGMPAVSVRESVNLPNKAIMKPNNTFIDTVGFLLYPELRISQKHSDSFGGFHERDSLCSRLLFDISRPTSKSGQTFSYEVLANGFRLGDFGPILRLKNVLSLPLVQLFLGCETRNQLAASPGWIGVFPGVEFRSGIVPIFSLGVFSSRPQSIGQRFQALGFPEPCCAQRGERFVLPARGFSAP